MNFGGHAGGKEDPILVLVVVPSVLTELLTSAKLLNLK